MGGCRCTFQYCENNTNNCPGMHFFHFPIRDLALCEKWARFSNNMAFMDLPKDKLKNKVVCVEHFRDACFMNYKKERLVKTAAPTLLKIPSSGEIIDLEEPEAENTVEVFVPNSNDDETTSPLIINESTQKTPVILNSGNRKRPFIRNGLNVSTKENENITVGLHIESVDELSSIVEDQPVVKLTKLTSIPKQFSTAAKKAKILNSTCLVKTPRPNILLKSSPEITTTNKRETKEIIIPMEELVDVKEDYDEAVVINSDNNELLNQSQIIFSDNSVPKDLFLVHSNKQLEQITDVKSICIDIMKKCHDFHSLVETVGKQQQTILQLQQKLADNSIATAAAGSNSKNKSDDSESSSKFNTNKLQLFNSIKKYLNPSMVSLLRMELFGTTEREWKKDEKSFSTELLKLGSNTYEYMRDEWRFRLPPKKDVEKWIQSKAANDDDDEEELDS